MMRICEFTLSIFLVGLLGLSPRHTGKADRLSIHSLRVTSDIAYRFATTEVVSKLRNDGNMSQEAVFKIQLPNTAFISNFSMVIDGVEYPGDVKEKEQAKREYERAKSRGQSAGKVSAKPRNTNKFEVAVNVAANKDIIFTLTYQELLQRKMGFYENTVYVDPGQLVDDFRIDVNIRESRAIKDLYVSPLKNDIDTIDPGIENDLAMKTMLTPNRAHVGYSPTLEQQRDWDVNGLNGQFSVRYDVERDEGAGEIQVVDGYFVHFFSPKGLPPGGKNVVFVLDLSSSMMGTKLQQVKDAMGVILQDLREDDLFGIIAFSSKSSAWSPNLMQANKENIDQALEFVVGMEAVGGTNINDALVDAIQFLSKEGERALSGLASLIIFLTDGDPTVGETNRPNILTNIRRLNERRYAVFSLGFGSNLNFDFLKQLSLQNIGVARKIYEDSDASLQLQGFYDEISTPLLSNVDIQYLDDKVNKASLTNNHFPSLFRGSECVLAGRLGDMNANVIATSVTAFSADGPVNYAKEISLVHGSSNDFDLPSSEGLRDFTERLWAYLTIKELLDGMLRETDQQKKLDMKQRALELSLKYNFVTPLTSMIVVKPDEPSTESGTDEDGKDYQEDRSSPNTPTSARKHVASSPPSRGSTFADNDPHFMISVSGSDRPVCFDINGVEGEVYQLIHDQEHGLVVNAQIIEASQRSKMGKLLTYFGKIAIIKDKTVALAAPHSFKVNKTPYSWRRGQEIFKDGTNITWPDRSSVAIVLAPGIQITLVRHVQRGSNPGKAEYLGFYINDGSGFSKRVHGLMGQFEHRQVKIQPKSSSTTLRFMPPNRPHKDAVIVHSGKRRNLLNKQHVPCWHVGNNGRGFLDGMHNDYRVNKLTSKSLPRNVATIMKSRNKSNQKRQRSKANGRTMHFVE